MSTAKRTGLMEFEINTIQYNIMFGKPFIYKTNSKGPSIDPWGTPL
jgi:hypothetical protein